MISGRVLDAGFGIAPGYASKLLALAGMDVVKLEPPVGDPLRRHTASNKALGADETGVLFQFLHQGKSSVAVKDWPNFDALDALFADAAIFICSLSPKDFDPKTLVDKYPHLVVVSITPYGTEGPYANRPATEFIIQAESGVLAMRANREDPPVHAAGQIVQWVGGAYAAVASLGALHGARKGLNSRYIDLSLAEVAHTACSNFSDLSYSMMGKPEITDPSRAVELPEIHPTRDGYVGFTANSRQQFDDFLILIERPDWHGDDQLASYAGRRERRDEFIAAVNNWTQKYTSNEVLEKAAAFRLPCVPVNNGKSLLENEHLAARGVFMPDADQNFTQPRQPWIANGIPTQVVKPAPKLGASEVQPLGTSNQAATSKGLPLEGLFVLDMTSWWAGPAASQILASFGADVIHVESTKRPDGMRMTGGLFAGQHSDWWERSMFFLHANLNKRDLTLDLSTEAGGKIIRQLIAKADVVMENFTPRVMENFGLDFASIRELNPDVVNIRMPAFGLSGPWRDYPGFAQTMEQMSGMAWLTGHSYDQPHNQRGPSDPNAGMHAAFVALMGLFGGGGDFEVTMVESALNAAAELVLEYSAYGNIMEREGNRSPYGAPQNLYQCQHSDGGLELKGESWLAISVANDTQWSGLKEALGNPDWSDDDSLDSHLGRRQNHDLIDEELSKWAATQNLDAAVDALVAHNVPAGKVRDIRLMPEHPQFVARKYYEEVDHPAVGKHLVPTLPFKMSGIENWVSRPAPTLGQHSKEILMQLGFSEAEVDKFFETGVSGTQPVL